MPTDSLARRLIYKHRMSLGMSPEQYAVRVGCSGGTVRRVERGFTPFLHNQIKFAAALEMEREDLWGLPPIAEVRDRVRVAA